MLPSVRHQSLSHAPAFSLGDQDPRRKGAADTPNHLLKGSRGDGWGTLGPATSRCTGSFHNMAPCGFWSALLGCRNGGLGLPKKTVLHWFTVQQFLGAPTLPFVISPPMS